MTTRRTIDDPSAKRLGPRKPAAQRRGPPVEKKQPRKVDAKAGLKKVGRALTSLRSGVASGELMDKYRKDITLLALPGGAAKTAVGKAAGRLGGKALIKQAEKKLYGTGRSVSGQLVSQMNRRRDVLLEKARSVMGTKGATKAAGLGGGKPSIHPEVWSKALNPTKVARPSRLRRYGPGK